MAITIGFLKNSLLNFNRNILSVLLGFISTIIIARVLGPEKQGIYTMVLLLPTMLVTLLNIGISAANVYFIGKKKFTLTTIVSTNIFLAILISVFSIILGIFIIIFFGRFFFEGVPTVLLLIILSLLPFLFINSFLQGIFHGLQDFKAYNLIIISGNIANTFLIILTLLVLQMNIIGALLSYIISVLTPVVILFIYLRRRKISFKLSSISIDYIKSSIKYGFKVHFSNILSFINYRADLIMIAFFLNPASVGIYNVAVSVSEKLWIVSQPVTTVLFPKISSSESNEERNLLTTMVARNVLALSFIVSLLILLISDLFVFLAFGDKYQTSADIIKLLLIGITLLSAEKVLSNDLAGRGRPELNIFTSVFTVIINILLNLIFIPKWGVYGGALATTISYSLTFLVKLYIFCNETKVKYSSVIVLNKADIALYQEIYKKLLKGLKK